jgi:hypothetical protein
MHSNLFSKEVTMDRNGLTVIGRVPVLAFAIHIDSLCPDVYSISSCNSDPSLDYTIDPGVLLTSILAHPNGAHQPTVLFVFLPYQRVISQRERIKHYINSVIRINQHQKKKNIYVRIIRMDSHSIISQLHQVWQEQIPFDHLELLDTPTITTFHKDLSSARSRYPWHSRVIVSIRWNNQLKSSHGLKQSRYRVLCSTLTEYHHLRTYFPTERIQYAPFSLDALTVIAHRWNRTWTPTVPLPHSTQETIIAIYSHNTDIQTILTTIYTLIQQTHVSRRHTYSVGIRYWVMVPHSNTPPLHIPQHLRHIVSMFPLVSNTSLDIRDMIAIGRRANRLLYITPSTRLMEGTLHLNPILPSITKWLNVPLVVSPFDRKTGSVRVLEDVCRSECHVEQDWIRTLSHTLLHPTTQADPNLHDRNSAGQDRNGGNSGITWKGGWSKAKVEGGLQVYAASAFRVLRDRREEHRIRYVIERHRPFHGDQQSKDRGMGHEAVSSQLNDGSGELVVHNRA